jgi:hypothetical protein
MACVNESVWNVTCTYTPETPQERVARLEKELADAREAAKPKKTRGEIVAEEFVGAARYGKVVGQPSGVYIGRVGNDVKVVPPGYCTPEEIEHRLRLKVAAAIDAERADAAKQEREACAELAASFARGCTMQTHYTDWHYRENVSAAIRART